MNHIHQKTESIWQKETSPLNLYPSLARDISTDVCVIGGGIAGLSTAYLLARRGFGVTVVDKEHFGHNETSLTTAHLSNALGTGFHQLQKWHGDRGIQLAYESHTAAIDKIETIASEEEMDCDFLRVNGYLFLSSQNVVGDLKREQLAAQIAGFKNVELLPHVPTHFFDSGFCLRFPDQAQMHPVKYLRGLLKCIQKYRGKIFYDTQIRDISGTKDVTVTTTQGHSIHCQYCVVATNVPINTRFAIHMKEASYRSYAIGMNIPHGQLAPMLLWDTENPYHYVRLILDPQKQTDILVVGGEDHRTGQKNDPELQFLKLKIWARETFGIETEITYKWSGQIIEPVDGLAYIGAHSDEQPHIFIATGASGHGMTYGTIAGLLIRDLIMNKQNEWAYLYNPKRLNLRSVGHFLKENINSATQYRDWLTAGVPEAQWSLQSDQGAVLRDGFSKVATYCDVNRHVHQCSAVCPHLGGIVHWNDAEKTWDCPCHGSRFNRYGEVINGPANQNLKPVHPIDTSEQKIFAAQPLSTLS